MHINIRTGIQNVCSDFIPDNIFWEMKKKSCSEKFQYEFPIQQGRNNPTKEIRD